MSAVGTTHLPTSFCYRLLHVFRKRDFYAIGLQEKL